jgi:hypothetical protein
MLGVLASVASVGVLFSSIAPAAGQSAAAPDSAATTGTIDPASLVDIDDFSERAEAWADAQLDHRAAGLVRAEALAAQTKAAEAEDARIAAQQAEREAAEERERQQAEADRRAAEATSTTTTAPTPTVSEPGVDPSAGAGAGDTGAADEGDAVAGAAGAPSAAQWLALRECEASNNYTAVSGSGRYRGAYQFSIATWDWLAAARYPELVGVDPIAASPAQQDQMAVALYEVYGANPWPICGLLLL